jgi:two-component system NtrC family sensor kinase
MDALAKAYVELKTTQAQVLQNEKMASIGLLAAGVAHEINNPIGFVSSNLNTLGKYLKLLTEYINRQDKIIEGLDRPDILAELEALRLSLKVDHILGDVGCLISESLDGTSHVRKIVNDLNVFSRKDDSAPRLVNLADILDSTITLVWNEIKYKVALQKNYGKVPPILGNSQQLNQVFMNMLINAGHAIESGGKITVSTWAENGNAFVSIGDTGHGIALEHLNRIFEPFFTTKEVGKGTGLGLSISYDIINKHSGEIIVESVVGKGTTFTVKLPLAKEQ